MMNMLKIGRRSLKVQLLAVVLSFLSFLISLGLLSIRELNDVDRASADIRDHWLQSIRVLGDLNNFTSDYRTAEASHLLAANPEQSANTERDMVSLAHQITATQDSYEHIVQGSAEQAMYQGFRAEWNAYQSISSQVLAFSRASRKDAGGALYMSASRIAYAKASDTLGKLTARTVAGASKASGRAVSTHAYARKLIIAVVLLLVLGIIGALQYVTRVISRPLLELAARMRALAGQDTDVDIRGTLRDDEIGEMARAVAVFRNNAIELAHSQSGLLQQASMLEEKLQYEQRMTGLQRNFLAMASHEFRIPLTIIDGHAQRMVKMQADLQPAQLAERAEKIRNAVLRMTSVIDNMLTSSRLLDGEPGLYFHPQEIDIAALLHDVCHLHREIWPKVSIFEKLGQAPLIILGDPHLLFQAFSNLLANAIKYSPHGGLITVQASVQSDHLVVSTQDNGIGIPHSDRAQLFERYHRGSNVAGITGTGIGLYLVKMVISLHGGKIEVFSAEGQGSTFIAHLPMARKK